LQTTIFVRHSPTHLLNALPAIISVKSSLLMKNNSIVDDFEKKESQTKIEKILTLVN